MSEVNVESAKVLRGAVRVPGDKSASHRALLISALADGLSSITGLSNGDDVSRTKRIIQQLGAEVREHEGGVAVVGPEEGLRGTTESLDCGNSGTAMRLLAGLLSGVPGEHVLVGDDSLTARPMARVIEPLQKMGAQIEGRAEGLPPLQIVGRTDLNGIIYEVPTPSAQVKSAILFAGLTSRGTTTVTEAIRTRSTTEDMLRTALVEVKSSDVGDGRSVTLSPGRPMTHHWLVPGDPSQAAFFAVLGLIHGNASIGVVDILSEPERTGFVQVLSRMGGHVQLNARTQNSSLTLKSSRLVATEIPSSEIPSVDEVPALTVAAAAAVGVTKFRDMGELRVKESDRFAGSMELATALGCETWSEGDDFFVRGLGSASAFKSFQLNAGLDHRIVMSAAIAATAGNGGVIDNWETVQSSYPHFFLDLTSIQ
jgi:3-phosphoshikimate 1-carboxyvinyltransferase